jgi:glucans biosynthesis protein C
VRRLPQRRKRRFIEERASRLLLPLLLGTLLIISIQAWLRALNFGTFSGGFISFYPSFFNGINTGPGSRNNFDYGHFWFLLYLFVFSVIALPLLLRLRRGSSPLLNGTRRLAAGAGILVPMLWIALLEAVFRPG